MYRPLFAERLLCVRRSSRHWGTDQRTKHINLCPHEIHFHSNEKRRIITSNYIIYQLAITAVEKQWKTGMEWWGREDSICVLSSLIKRHLIQLQKEVSVSCWMLGIASARTLTESVLWSFGSIGGWVCGLESEQRAGRRRWWRRLQPRCSSLRSHHQAPADAEGGGGSSAGFGAQVKHGLADSPPPPPPSGVVRRIERRASLILGKDSELLINVSAAVFRISCKVAPRGSWGGLLRTQQVTQQRGVAGWWVKARCCICVEVQVTGTVTNLAQMLGHLKVPGLVLNN